MKKAWYGYAAVLLIVAGLFAYFIFWPPAVKMIALPEDSIPASTLASVAPTLNDVRESGLKLTFRAYGSGEGYEFIGYSAGTTREGLFVIPGSPAPFVIGGDCGTLPFGTATTYEYDKSTNSMKGFMAWGFANDRRVTKVIGVTGQGQTREVAPQNGFWWLWEKGTGKWARFDALDANGRVLYSKVAYP